MKIMTKFLINASLLLISAYFARPAGASISGLDVCTEDQQRQILPSLLGCEVRETVVELDLPNETSYLHVVPNYVSVNRCGGSCHSRFHSCIPTTTRTRTIDVLLVPRNTHAGATAAECATAEVEEHVSCSCGCPQSAAECIASASDGVKIFVESECRCVCADNDARAACLSRGWFWNVATCQCLCRNPLTFPSCPSGYSFDGADACVCVEVSERAAAVFETLVLILVCFAAFFFFSAVQIYRQRSRKDELRGGHDGVTVAELRTLFRQISQGSRQAAAAGAACVNWLGYSHIDGTSTPMESQQAEQQPSVAESSRLRPTESPITETSRLRPTEETSTS